MSDEDDYFQRDADLKREAEVEALIRCFIQTGQEVPDFQPIRKGFVVAAQVAGKSPKGAKAWADLKLESLLRELIDSKARKSN